MQITNRQISGLVVVCAVAFTAAISQSLFSMLLEPIKRDLQISDTTVGLLSGLGVVLVSAVAAFPIGWVADRFGRKIILALCIVIWSAAAGILGMAASVNGIAGGVVGISLGEAALIPLLYGLVSQGYFGKDRDRANAALIAVLTLGGAGIYSIGGYLIDLFTHNPLFGLDAWRAVCLTSALLGFILVFFVPVILGADTHVEKNSAISESSEDFSLFMKREWLTIVMTYCGMSLFSAAYYVFRFWTPAIVQRTFELNAAETNAQMGPPFIIATIIGLGLSYSLLPRARRLFGHDVALRMLMIGCALGLIPVILMPFAQSATQFIVLAAALTGCITLSMSLAPLLMQSFAPQRFTSRVIGLYPIVVTIPLIILPAGVGALSDASGADSRALMQINAGLMGLGLAGTVIVLWFVRLRYSALVARVQGIHEEQICTANNTSE